MPALTTRQGNRSTTMPPRTFYLSGAIATSGDTAQNRYQLLHVDHPGIGSNMKSLSLFVTMRQPSTKSNFIMTDAPTTPNPPIAEPPSHFAGLVFMISVLPSHL